jgi:hypothetical protein
VAGFVQVIEWKTSRIEEVQKLNDEWRERFPQMGPSRIMACADRDHPGSYMTVVEFESYEAAMENSKDPSTSEFADRMTELCDGPAVWHNLDVMQIEDRSS